MSEKPLPSFRAIAAPLDVDDAALDRLNATLGVPTLTKPVANRKQTAEASATVQDVRASLEKLTVEVPAYVMDAIKRAALDRRTTVRHVILTALKAEGFDVSEADLVPDGRRRRATS
jgi:hypothetical protein